MQRIGTKITAEKRVPQHLQEVRDDQGRQRLHGAFQGGFSAGYYNSVGSKEGWQPKQFSSSRNARGDFNQTIHDYMDLEDIQEFGKDAISEFESLGSTANEMEKKRINNINRLYNVVEDLVKSVDSGIGMRIMVEQGYHKGMTVGPKTKRKEICNLVSNLDKDPLLKKLQGLLLEEPDSNTYGRGYNPHAFAPEFIVAKQKTEKLQKERPKSKPKGGFGTGIFDDESDYDEYEESTNDYNSYVDEDGEPMMHRKEKPKAPPKPAISKPRYGEIEGFHSAKELKKPPALHLAAYPPTNFKPNPVFFKDINKDSKRGLEDDEKDDIQQSIFSFIAKKQQERMSGITRKAITVPTVEKRKAYELSTVSKDIAENALKGFMPFGKDLPKQTRYRGFLQKVVDGNTAPIPKDQITAEMAAESKEFSTAANLYKPLSEMMASRFTNETDEKKKSQGPETKEMQIIYGRLTRTESAWKPCKILCRRVAVAYRKDEDEDDIDPEDKMALNPQTMEELMKERDRLVVTGHIGDADKEVLTKDDMMNEKEEEIVEEEEEPEPEPEEVVVASMDLFKAIFDDSDEEMMEVEVYSPKASVPIEPPTVDIVTESSAEIKSLSNDTIVKLSSKDTVARPPVKDTVARPPVKDTVARPPKITLSKPLPVPTMALTEATSEGITFSKPQKVKSKPLKKESEEFRPVFSKAKSKLAMEKPDLSKYTDDKKVELEAEKEDTLVGFRPQFTKPAKRSTTALMGKPRNKKQKVVAVKHESEGEEDTPSVKRPSAADFM
ncbi:G patch domain-containing protein 1 [Terramyces sp. JEL0728]|nr:G patch domain-containing protein 1 [Terramyces sp. JEL0728]